MKKHPRPTPLRTTALALLLVLPAAPALALDLVVTNPLDAPDNFPNNGVCQVDAGAGGGCTLRAALQTLIFAPPGSGPHMIRFDLPAGAPVIAPALPLPEITQPVTIDGSTQPGASANTLAVGNDAQVPVRIDGRGAGDLSGLRFQAGASGSVLRGVAVYGFALHGVELWGASNVTIAGSFIGTDGTGTGDDAGGGLANAAAGVYMGGGSENNTIGGAAAAERNLIVGGSSGEAVLISGQGAAGGNTVRGNYIGTTRSGNSPVATQRGIQVMRSNGNTIAGNVIGAEVVGIRIWGDSHANTVQGNHIGVGADGASPITPGTGAAQHGVWMLSDVLQNVAGSPQGTRIGGSVAEGNLIAHWGGDGVRMERSRSNSPPLRHHSVQGNRIWGTNGLGLQLIDTAAGEGAAPGGPPPQQVNNGIPTPVLASVTPHGTTGLTAAVTLAGGGANVTYAFELFGVASCHGSGYGPGEYPAGRFTATTDGTGSLNTTANVPGDFSGGGLFTLTATRESGPGLAETSEFSACRAAAGGGGNGGSSGTIAPVPTLGHAALGLLGALVGGLGLRARRREGA